MEEQLVVDFFTEEKKHWWHIAKRSLIRQFIEGSNLNILVAGLGGGMICEELASAGHTVVGIEISPLSCRHVSKEAKLPVINGNLENPLPFRSGTFDIIIMADVLEHLDNDGRLLAEASLCLKPGGMVIITAPAYPHMWSPWDARVNHKRRYSLAEIKDKLIKGRLNIKKASYFNMLLYPLVYIYRIVLKLPRQECSKRSDFSVFSGRAVNGLAAFYYMLERFLLKAFDLPFGLSIFAIGIKDG